MSFGDAAVKMVHSEATSVEEYENFIWYENGTGKPSSTNADPMFLFLFFCIILILQGSWIAENSYSSILKSSHLKLFQLSSKYPLRC